MDKFDLAIIHTKGFWEIIMLVMGSNYVNKPQDAKPKR